MPMKFILWLILFLSLFSFRPVFAENVLTMGYLTNARPPLINQGEDNSGVYQELYKVPAKKIGYRLKVIRLPKKRIISKFKEGEIDFYPGFNFTKERADYTYYIENGLPGGDVGVSTKNFKDIKNLYQLKGHFLLGPLGGPNYVEGIDGIKQHRIAELTIDWAINLIRKKRYDFYIYNRSSIEYYLSQQKDIDIKIHYDCCGGIKPMYLGFSRKSGLIKETKNPDYDSTLDISPDNFPVTLSNDCFAYKFAKTLGNMRKSGETMAIYNKYFGIKE